MAHLSSPCSKPHHIVLFPFMAKGHTIPLLHLAQLLLHRGDTAVTIFTTPASHPFISQSLPGDDGVSIVDLPFPDHIQGVPEGAESTDKLPSMSLFLSFVRGVELMRPAFEQELEKIHHHVSCIISDGFLPWTLESASRFGIPLLSFFGMSYYASAVSREVGANGLMSIPESDDEAVALPGFPWIRVTRNDFDDPFNKRDPSGPHWDPIVKGFLSHCGWNSVLEGICAGVPILAWPMMAEQYLNAKMVVEEIKVGVRVSTVDGTSKGFVAAESLNRAVREVQCRSCS